MLCVPGAQGSGQQVVVACKLQKTKGSACYGASVRLVKPQAGCQLGKAHNLDYFKLVTMIRRYVHPLDLSLAYQAWTLVY